LGIWHTIFRTTEDDVRLKLIECLAPFVNALPREGQLEVFNALLDVWSSGGFTSWREREGIAKSLNDLLSVGAPQVPGIVGKLLMHALVDSVNTVREAALLILPNIWMTLQGKNLLNIIRSDILSLARSEMSRRRMTYIACQQALLLPGPEGGEPPIQINDELCSTFVSLASDHIVGVRIRVARLIGLICGQSKPIPELILGVIPVLSQDSSNEVRSYVVNCLVELGSHQEMTRTSTRSASAASTFSRPPPVSIFQTNS
jgi:serine/threonine-protein phosphatase 4 regulatory subunit 1